MLYEVDGTVLAGTFLGNCLKWYNKNKYGYQELDDFNEDKWLEKISSLGEPLIEFN